MSYSGDIEEKLRNEWGKVVADAREEIRYLKNKLSEQEKVIDELRNDAKAGRHFKDLMKAVNDNPITKSAWDRFMVSLRMVDND